MPFNGNRSTLEKTVARRKQGINPFYVLLVIVGTAFVVTAFAHGLMAFNLVNPTSAPSDSSVIQDPNHPLWQMLRRHGNQLLLWEVALLAVLTVSAMATDTYWRGRPARRTVGSDETKTVDTPERSTPV